MSDTSLNKFLGQGDDAVEGAFTPVPPTTASGPDALVLFLNTDSGALKYWNGASFTTVGSGGGTVVQVVNTQTGAVATGTTTVPQNDTIPQNTDGTEFMTLAITPTNAANKLQIDVVMHISCLTGTRNIAVCLFQDSTAGALAVGEQAEANGGFVQNIKFTHYMTAGTTSSTTFKVRAGVETSGTVTFNGSNGNRQYGGVLASSITITEIVP